VIAQAQVNRPDLRWPFPERMAERLTGARVDRLRRRSKYILADLSTDETLIIHLGMSGRMIISAGETRAPRPASSTTPPRARETRPCRPRHRGGRAHHLQRRPPLRGHGPCADGRGRRALAPEGPRARTARQRVQRRSPRAAFRGKRTPVKSALLDQRIVAGLGNIYVCEALHRARISPLRHAGRIGRGASRGLSPISAMCWPRRSRPGAHPSATTGRRMAIWAISNTISASTDARGSPAKPPIAVASSAARCSPGGRVSTAPSAKDSLNPALAVLTLPP
jgi:formamidopyrimidine-DNA glycosylase